MKFQGEAKFASIAADGDLPVYALAIDQLGLARRVSLIKIDAEGHERAVIEGMIDLVRRDHPVIIYEASRQAGELLESLGYRLRRMPGSANHVAEFADQQDGPSAG